MIAYRLHMHEALNWTALQAVEVGILCCCFYWVKPFVEMEMVEQQDAVTEIIKRSFE